MRAKRAAIRRAAGIRVRVSSKRNGLEKISSEKKQRERQRGFGKVLRCKRTSAHVCAKEK
jgi:hypothetical protein